MYRQEKEVDSIVMQKSSLSRFTVPAAKSGLVGIGLVIVIISTILIIDSVSYPYLIDIYYDDLYLRVSSLIPVSYLIVVILTFLIALSSCFAAYKSATHYPLIHSGLTSIIVPLTILVFFLASSWRYKPSNYTEDYNYMISDYRISASMYNDKTDQDKKETKPDHERLHTFTNNLDKIQAKFQCCGVESKNDWTKYWDDYIAPSCCKDSSSKKSESWAKKFGLPPEAKDFKFKYCESEATFEQGCEKALEKDEAIKYDNLCWLTIVLIVLVVVDAILALIMFGISKSERSLYDDEALNEFAMSMTSIKPRPSQPALTNIGHRPSFADGLLAGVVTTKNASLMSDGIIVSPETKMLHAKAQSVRFNIPTSTVSSRRPSIFTATKFSDASRRGSSFI